MDTPSYAWYQFRVIRQVLHFVLAFNLYSLAPVPFYNGLYSFSTSLRKLLAGLTRRLASRGRPAPAHRAFSHLFRLTSRCLITITVGVPLLRTNILATGDCLQLLLAATLDLG